MKKLAFTLIEILIVIVVIGIISSFIIVSMSSITQKATIAKSQAFSSSIKNAIMSNLISEWRLDETGVDTTAKDSWGANNGTWNGSGGGSYTSPSWRTSSECVSNGCLAFDGTDDYVEVFGSDSSSSNLAITGAITLSVWVKFNVAGTDQFIAGRGSAMAVPGNYGYTLARYGGNNMIYFDTYSTTTRDALASVSSVADTNWHLIVGVWDGTTSTNGKKIYIDGFQNSQKTSGISVIGQPNYTFRCGRSSANQFHLSGLIDDVRIYNAAIPTSQIEQNYFLGLNKLYRNQNIGLGEYKQRISELNNNLVSK